MKKHDLVIQFLLVAITSALMTWVRYGGDSRSYPGLGDFFCTMVWGAVIDNMFVSVWIPRFIVSCVIVITAFWTIKRKTTNYVIVNISSLIINVLMGIGDVVVA